MSKKKKIISVVGARPNFMKLAPIERELKKHRSLFNHLIVHTGQHYDHRLSKVFFKDLDLPEPDIYLGAGSGSHAEQTAKIMTEFEKVVLKEKPDLVIVFGDVNSTIACALVCSKIHHAGGTIPIAHVEAGLRSFDNTMPEEINRIVTDALSEMLFITERAGVENLLEEGVSKKKIYLTGDTMIDSLVHFSKKISSSDVLKRLGLSKQSYILATIHRPVNVDSRQNLEKIISIFEKISKEALKFNPEMKIVLPIHPRTLKMAEKFSLLKRLKNIKNLITTEPAGYTDFIKLLTDCKFVVTDSGGIQEEATFLKIPCLTLRESFERPETLILGSNTLCGLNENLIIKKTAEIYSGKYKKGKIPRLMDGKAAQRIVKAIKTRLF
ncbi:MAG TPA: UDP-N-acetylglucosamine 2-epimerase (non-hydrolyzing) [Ignavibacteria bacterium]|nr:UDP-N-acetylglucosamine 2-epimerase (non-hydrolyzing) [Ignavibacteria bacterium]HRJ05585.1 UDP-N-acetylglucosamine 2-epimerase (non-hydrolyzing) [Ignavibacteria bacterium]HRJ85817.1 UDP-N-acetylglucosamine 2-epimerase (non-hydrolyzing) [Ignavibacteria bacterium]